jgi:endonuclease/exonuclease/phosphatase (EEP) superfamily protein YafD
MKFKHYLLLSQISQFLVRFLIYSLTITTLVVILLALIGQIVRDRTVELGLLMYIPVLPLGIWAVALDLWQAGYSLPGFRFGLTLIGLGLMTWGEMTMIGQGATLGHLNPDIQVSVLHWNISWGGVGKTGWQSISRDIRRRHPDIAILTETPHKFKLNRFLNKQMGWSMVMYEDTRSNPLAICSAWPLQLEQFVKIRDGVAMTVIVRVKNYPLRILAVDGKRNMSKRVTILSRQVLPRWRTPLLNDIARFIARSEQQGKPIDIIAGDFNTISRSLGFDALAQVGGGYHLASKYSAHWRGTWISILPLYDIDHVWVHKRFPGLSANLFTNLATDHRGQLVKFHLLPTTSL